MATVRAYPYASESLQLCFALAISCGTPVAAQFINESSLLGITTSVATSYNGTGLSTYDFNQDGWDDLTIARGSQNIIFLINNQGVLEPAAFSIPNIGNKLVQMVLWGDYDGDGHLDLLVTKDDGPVELWKNDGNFNFTEVSQAAGLLQGNFRHVGAAFCDFDHDGDLDLYIAKFYHPSLFSEAQFAGALYRNNGDGTFTDITVSAGVFVNPRPIFQPVFLDYNNDGWEDLYLITDRVFSENALFRNNGNGTFTNVTAGSGAGIMICSMSGTVGDFDNDTDLDIYITNSPPVGSKFLKNNGNGTFSEIAAAMNVQVSSHIGWGAMWLDYNNDSYQDLFVSLTTNIPATFAGNKLFRNNDGLSFADVSSEMGIVDEITQTYVCAKGDFNNDGYYDFALNNKLGFSPKLYMNQGGDNHYLSISLRGVIANMEGIGSWIKCYAGGVGTVQFSLCGENLIGQNPNRYIFGLNQNEVVDSLFVEWNSGTRDVFYNLQADQHLLVYEGLSAYHNMGIESNTGQSHLCPGDSLVLNFGTFEACQWSTGEMATSIVVHQPGTYTATGLTPWGTEVISQAFLITAPSPIGVVEDVVHESCAEAKDGFMSLSISGPYDPYSLGWNTGDSSLAIGPLAAGMYNYSFIDSSGCNYHNSIELLPSAPILSIVFTTEVLCHGDSSGTAMVFLFGGSPPYSLDWMDLDPAALAAGEHIIEVTDAAACVDEINIVIVEAPPLSLSLDLQHEGPLNTGSAAVFASGGKPPYTYVWSQHTSTEAIADNLAAGTYEVLVSDDNGCSAVAEFTIESTLKAHYSTPNTSYLYPNPTVGNLNVIHHAPLAFFDFYIINSAGYKCAHALRHRAQDPISTEQLPVGVYTLVLENEHLREAHRFVKMKE